MLQNRLFSYQNCLFHALLAIFDGEIIFWSGNLRYGMGEMLPNLPGDDDIFWHLLYKEKTLAPVIM